MNRRTLADRVLIHATDATALVSAALEAALDLVGGRCGTLVTLAERAGKPGVGAVEHRVTRPPDGQIVVQEAPLKGPTETALQEVLATGRPHSVRAPCAAPAGSTAGTIALPLIHRARIIAVLHATHSGTADPQALEALAPLLAAGLQRVRFYEWTRRSGYDLSLIGTSAALRRVEELVERVAGADCPVLITGEPGTGKELVARAIHFSSRRCERPFLAVNCGAFTSDDLIASELFGSVKGAFTDAKVDRKGKFELARQGTLFLDEVSSTRPSMQVALLRALRYGEIQKVGAEDTVLRADVRVVAASNQDLRARVERGLFREDLYSRLRVTEIRLPPLRERREDVPLLARHFVERFSRTDGVPSKDIDARAMRALTAHSWPDNVAGLENAVRSALLFSNGQAITLQDLPDDVRARTARGAGGRDDPAFPAGRGGRRPLAEVRRTAENQYLVEALEAHQWNVSRTARSLGISRQALQKRIRGSALKPPRATHGDVD